MSLLEKTSADLNSSKLVLHHLHYSFQSIQSNLHSIIVLTEQWENFHNSFSSIQVSLGEQLKELETKEREINSLHNSLSNQKKDVELLRKSLDNERKGVELRQKKLDSVEKSLVMKEKDVCERLQVLSLEKKRVTEWCKAVEAKEKRVDERIERCVAVEVREKEVEEKGRNEGLEEREKEVEERFRVLHLREKEVGERCKAVEVRENGVNTRCLELERREKEAEERCKVVEVKEKRIDERCRVVELKEREIDERCTEVELREKGVIEGLGELEAKEKRIDERCRVVELKEREIDESCKELELGEKGLIEGLRELEVKRQRLDERRREVESREREIDERCKVVELRERGEIDVQRKAQEIDGMEMKSEPPTVGGTDGFRSLTLKQCLNESAETLVMYLNERVDEHNLMEEEVRIALNSSGKTPTLVLAALDELFSGQWGIDNVANETSATRSSCVLLLKQLINVKHSVGKKVMRKAKALAERWRDKITEEGESESHYRVLVFLLMVVAFGMGYYYESDELQRLYEMVKQESIAPQLHQELFGVSEGNDMATSPTQVKTGKVQSTFSQVPDGDAPWAPWPPSKIDYCSTISSLCHCMDASGLRAYIGRHLLHEIYSLGKVLDAIKCAPDPAKLILDAVKTCDPSESTAIEKANCVFLLELLMKLQKQQPSLNSLNEVEQLRKPPLTITLDLRDEAKRVACMWKDSLAKTGHKVLEVYGFLQFVATYQLVRSFNEDELLRLFKVCYSGDLVYRPEQNPYLCRALGLTKRIPGLVKNLVKKDKRLHAIKYICSFMMESSFPLAPLLEDHLTSIKKKVEKIQTRRKGCHSAKVDAAGFELRNLQSVVQYINKYGLESEISTGPLKSRIKELELQIAESETSTIEVELVEATELKEGLKHNISFNSEMCLVENSLTQVGKKVEKDLLAQASPACTRSESSVANKSTSSPCNSLVSPQQNSPAQVAKVEKDLLPEASPAGIRPESSGGNKSTSSPCNSLVTPQENSPTQVVKKEEKFLLPDASPDSTRPESSSKYKCTSSPCNISMPPKQNSPTQAEMHLSKSMHTISPCNSSVPPKQNSPTQAVKEVEKNILRQASPASTRPDSSVGNKCRNKRASSPSNSLLPPQQKKLRADDPITTGPMSKDIYNMSVPLPTPQSSQQQPVHNGPYAHGYQAHFRPIWPPPGQWATCPLLGPWW